MPFLNRHFLGNPVQSWLIAAAATVLTLGVLWILQDIAVRRLLAFVRRRAADADRAAVQPWIAIRWPVQWILALYAGSLVLELPAGVTVWLRTIAVLAVLVQVAVWGAGLIAYWGSRYRSGPGDRPAATGTVSFLMRLLLYGVVVLVALDNIPGIELTTLIASLGITGIAIALAVQNILTDLFASVVIALDRPFEIGDTIAVDAYEGVVEQIGVKSTRVRSPAGEQVIFSNSDLLRSRVRNLQRMTQRRVAFSLRVVYDTPQATAAAIPGILREIVAAQEHARFARATLARVGAAGLDFEVVYYVLSPDYDLYLAVQQAINLGVLERFRAADIRLAPV